MPSSRTVILIAIILQIIWGLVPSASQFVIDEIPVELYVSIRWSISGFIFAGYVWFSKSWRPISIRDFFAIALLGVGGYGLASLGTLYGLKVGGVSNFALMSALGPIVISVASILFLKERPNRWFYFALPLCVLGLIFLVIGKYQISTFQIAGLSALLIIAGYSLEATVFVFSKHFKIKVSISQYLAISQLSAAILFWLLQGFVFQQHTSITNLSTRGLAAAMFVSIVACVLCYAVLYWLLGRIEGHRLALFDGIHAVSASVFGYFIFQETLSPFMLLGGAFIFSGLILGNIKKQNESTN